MEDAHRLGPFRCQRTPLLLCSYSCHKAPGQLQPTMTPPCLASGCKPLKATCASPPPSPCVTVTSVSPEVVALDHLSVIFHTGHLQMTLTVQAETSRVGLCVQASLVTCKCLVSGQWGHCGVQDGLPVRAQMAELPVFYSLRVRRVDSVYLSWTSACRMQEMLSSPLPQSCITLS